MTWTDDHFNLANATWLKQKKVPVQPWLFVYYYVRQGCMQSEKRDAVLITIYGNVKREIKKLRKTSYKCKYAEQLIAYYITHPSSEMYRHA
jgi:hypothetical protein